MLRQVIHRVRCLANERHHKIDACKNDIFIRNRYRNLKSDPSDITQLWGLSLAKQRDLRITVERPAIRIALSRHGTYVCSKGKSKAKVSGR